MQGLFQQSSSQFLRLIFFVTVSIVLTFIDSHNDTLQGFRSSVSTLLVQPLQYIANSPAHMIRWSQRRLAMRSTLLRENEALQAENLLLKSEQLILDALKTENIRLRELLNASEIINNDVLIAEVMTIDLDPYKQLIQLNKGEYHGVSIGQAIVDAHGVMGQIVYTSQMASTALLISDPSHTLPVQINRNGLRTIVRGLGNAEDLELLHIPTNSDIVVGDLIITSGLGGRFPINYPAGKVSAIHRESGQTFLDVKIKPMAKLDRSREVLIIDSNKPQ